MAVEGDYIYWTDLHYNTVNRALKSSGNKQIRLAEGVEPVSSVIVVKKSQLRRRGDLFMIVVLFCACVGWTLSTMKTIGLYTIRQFLIVSIY